MSKKKSPIKNAEEVKRSSYITWDNNDTSAKAAALSEYSNGLNHTVARYSDNRYRTDFSSLTDTSGSRPSFRSYDFDWFRPDQAAPTNSKEIIAFARYAYRRIGLIHNAIDLMGDFSCQGISLVHKNKNVEKFYKEWFAQIKGPFITERIANLLFREANLVIRMHTAKVNKKKKTQMQKALGQSEVYIEPDVDVKKNEIPWKYSFLDTLTVDYLSGSFSSISKNKALVLKVSDKLKKEIKALKEKLNNTQDEKDKIIIQDVLDNIAPDVLSAVEKNKPILLPPDKTYLLHYKKDDWQQWADPILYSAFESLNLYQRLQLADKAALDGAISKIRVWKIGDVDAQLFPDSNTTSLLADILGANTGGGTFDIVWGPDIELIETNSDVQSFLGEEKYKPTLMAIYATLGIPPTLTGTFGASGTTNNYISLKTLTERLNYVRSIIIDFWKEQIAIVQKAMGFKAPANIEFDFMSLDDPSSIAQLLLNLADRNIVSNEFVQKNVRANPDVENYRILNEEKFREANEMEKVSPYHKVNKEHELEKIALQTGIVSPSEVGVELKPKKNDKSLQDFQKESMKIKNASPSGLQSEPKAPKMAGRPKNSNDTVKRKDRTFTPKIRASYVLWAKSAQEKISQVVNPAILNGLNKTSLRNLTGNELDELERLKFEILCNLDIDTKVNEESISSAASNPLNEIHLDFNIWIKDAEKECGKLNIDQIRDLRAEYFAYLKTKG